MPLAILFGIYLDMGLFGIGLAAPLSSFAGALVGFGYFLTGKWKKSAIMKGE